MCMQRHNFLVQTGNLWEKLSQNHFKSNNILLVEISVKCGKCFDRLIKEVLIAIYSGQTRCSRYTLKTADEIQNELVLYMKKHKEHSSQIGSVIWECKKMDFDGYLDILALDQTPFNEVAIVLSAHMYKFHINIVMQGKYWTIKQDHDYKCCTCFLPFWVAWCFIVQRGKSLNQKNEAEEL